MKLKCSQFFNVVLLCAAGISATLPAMAVTYKEIKVPNSSTTSAMSVNSSGQIVGWFALSTSIRGFLLVNGKFSNVHYPGAKNDIATGIDDAGDIVGNYYDAGGNSHGFLDQSGTFTAIDFPGARRTFVYGINNNGDIVGYYNSDRTTTHGFTMSGGVFTSFDAPQSMDTQSYGINDAGDVVGLFVDSQGGQHGFEQISGGAFQVIDNPCGKLYLSGRGQRRWANCRRVHR